MLKPKVIDFPNTMLEITYINTINSISARMVFVPWAIIFFDFFPDDRPEKKSAPERGRDPVFRILHAVRFRTRWLLAQTDEI